MARPEVRVVVLFEDEAHSQFVRHLLRKLGVRDVRQQRCGGCTEVLEHFVSELRATRPRMAYQRNLALMVVVDADAATIQARVAQLNERLEEDARGRRGDEERIAFVIPALEIENWYVHLCVPSARRVDDGKDYKPEAVWRDLARDLAGAARTAVAAWDPEQGRTDPDSLVAARLELARLA